MLRMTYDEKARALYINLVDYGVVARTVEVYKDIVNVDEDKKGKVVGVEILLGKEATDEPK